MERNRRQLIKSGAISRLLRVFERVHKAGVKEDMLEAIALQSLQLCNVLLTDVVTSDRREVLIMMVLRQLLGDILPYLILFVEYVL